MSPFWISKSEISSRHETQAQSTATSDPVTVQSQSSGGGEKSKDLQGNIGEILYHGSTKGKMKPSLGSLALPEMEEGATSAALPRTEGGATGASTTTSVDVVDAAPEVADRSPVVGGGAGLARGTEEEEAMDKVKNKKKIYNEKERGQERNRGEGCSSFLSCFLSPFG
jgi:hypothetical protein